MSRQTPVNRREISRPGRAHPAAPRPPGPGRSERKPGVVFTGRPDPALVATGRPRRAVHVRTHSTISKSPTRALPPPCQASKEDAGQVRPPARVALTAASLGWPAAGKALVIFHRPRRAFRHVAAGHAARVVTGLAEGGGAPASRAQHLAAGTRPAKRAVRWCDASGSCGVFAWLVRYVVARAGGGKRPRVVGGGVGVRLDHSPARLAMACLLAQRSRQVAPTVAHRQVTHPLQKVIRFFFFGVEEFAVALKKKFTVTNNSLNHQSVYHLALEVKKRDILSGPYKSAIKRRDRDC